MSTDPVADLRNSEYVTVVVHVTYVLFTLIVQDSGGVSKTFWLRNFRD